MGKNVYFILTRRPICLPTSKLNNGLFFEKKKKEKKDERAKLEWNTKMKVLIKVVSGQTCGKGGPLGRFNFS